MYRQPLCAKETTTWSQPHSENERQQSVNRSGCCIVYNQRAVLQRLPIIEVSAAFSGNIVNGDVTAPENDRQQSVNRASTERPQSINRVSTERQQSWVLHLVQSKGFATAFTHNRGFGSLYAQKRQQHGHSPILIMSVNRASTNLGFASCIIQGLCYGICP